MFALFATLLALAPAPCRAAPPPPRYDHVVWIWMENKAYSDVIGSADAPYENSLARACAVATDYREVGHPSLPNYIAATSGGTWGISDNGSPSTHSLAVPSIYSQARSWREFEESAPGPCPASDTALYAQRHDPALYYVNLRSECRRFDLPLSRLSVDSLPQFTFITPDLCHDMHSCPVAAGDAWLANFVPRLLVSRTYRAGRTAIFVVWDEGRGQPLPFLAITPSVRPGTRLTGPLNHYSLLRTTEQLLGLPLLGQARFATPLGL